MSDTRRQADTRPVPALERIREIALLLGVADPQGLTVKGIPPVSAYGVEAYSIALLEERQATITAGVIQAILDFWYAPRPGWALAGERELDTFLRILAVTRPDDPTGNR